MHASHRVSSLLVAGTLAGCASAPHEELAASERAIASAVAAGAADLAASDLHLARTKIDLARRWMRAEDYEPARWLVQQARVDAEVAAVKAFSAARNPGMQADSWLIR
jgi:uncharacterized protein DUF4398